MRDGSGEKTMRCPRCKSENVRCTNRLQYYGSLAVGTSVGVAVGMLAATFRGSPLLGKEVAKDLKERMCDKITYKCKNCAYVFSKRPDL